MEKFSAGQRLITFQQYGSKNELINYVMLMFILSDFFQQQLYVNKTGSTVAGIKAAILKTLWIPVPPYNEQLRISNTLKSAINLIDSISKNKEILSTSISNTKSKILDLAIRGKIVPQDPNDEPASVLLERIRAEKEELIKQGKIKRDKKESVIFKGDDNSYYEKIDGEVSCIDEEIPYDIPDTWTWMRLENCCVKEIRRGKSPKYAEISNVIVFAQKCNTKYNGIDISLAQYLDKTTIKRYPTDEHMQDGDIVINSTGTGTLGRVGIYRNTDNTTGLLIVPDSHVTVIRSFSCISSYYLYAFMKAHQTELEKKGEGSTNQKELKPLTLKEMLIAVPPISEQKRINKSINVAFSHLAIIEKCLN
ncbi:restriction endonuclease subunit S [Dorea longicatena]|nr:restriction endonuclease subunit S [Dorea longicatena]NSD17929.1 restriction endonuclease subunit S [Dorea longicatena]